MHQAMGGNEIKRHSIHAEADDEAPQGPRLRSLSQCPGFLGSIGTRDTSASCPSTTFRLRRIDTVGILTDICRLVTEPEDADYPEKSEPRGAEPTHLPGTKVFHDRREEWLSHETTHRGTGTDDPHCHATPAIKPKGDVRLDGYQSRKGKT